MTRTLKERLTRAVVGAAVLATAIMIAVFPVTTSASAAPAEPVPAAVTAATSDSVGLLAVTCSTGTGWTNGDNTNSRNYAWASCYDSNPVTRPLNEFRVAWSCTGEGYMRFGPWTDADGKRQSGTCALGKRVDVNKVETEYIGP